MPGETIFLFEKGLALVNLIAFATLHWQLSALIGSRGLTPAREHIASLRRRSPQAWRVWPTLCFLWDSDFALNTYCRIGELCALLVLLTDAWPVTVLCFLACALCYASLVVVSQPWLGLQMHSNLVETTAFYAALAPFAYHSPSVFLWGFRWFIFRKMFSCGIGKLVSSDSSWKWPELSAMAYHYHTMPLPNPLSPYFHALPKWVHQFETLMTHVLEAFPIPFFALSPWWWPRFIFVLATVGLNVAINLSGNFGHLGLITALECIPVLDDETYAPFFPALLAVNRPIAPWSLSAIILGLVSMLPLVAYVLVSTLSLLDVFDDSGRFDRLAPEWLQDLHALYTRCRCLTRHSKFSNMTKFRWEFIIEGSSDGVTWKEYEFKFKPSRTDKRPPFIPGLMPSLDWQLWFLPLKHARQQSMPDWYSTLLDELLRGNPNVTALFGSNPFATSPPFFVRTVVYKYEYAPKGSNQWWIREPLSTLRHASAMATQRAVEARALSAAGTAPDAEFEARLRRRAELADIAHVDEAVRFQRRSRNGSGRGSGSDEYNEFDYDSPEEESGSS